MSGAPRRRPYPFDVIFNTVGLMAGASDKNQSPSVVGRKPQSLDQVSPSDYSYNAQQPVIDRVHSWDDMSFGYGLRMQRTNADRRYYYAVNADLSCGGVWQKGPSITTITPATTGNFSHFFEIAGVLYALGYNISVEGRGEYCLVRAGDLAANWTVSKYFGDSTRATDVAVFYSNMTGGAKYAYVAMGETTPIWRFDGTTWEQCVEIQTVTIANTPTAGHYHLVYNGTPTGEIAYNAPAADVQTALRAVSGLSAVTVTATGTTPNFTHTITFYGVTGNPPELTESHVDLTGGTIAIATVQDREIIYATAFAVAGHDLYRAHSTNLLSKVDVDADPFVEDNWNSANAFEIGDKSSAITRLAVNGTGALVIMKTDGIYTLDADTGDDVPLFPFLKTDVDADNGKAWSPWINDIYVAYRDGTYQLTNDMSLTKVGPERLLTNDSPVRGKITALCGHSAFALYAAVYNSDTAVDGSYLVKLGGYQENEERLPIWHGSISPKFSQKYASALYATTVGAPTGHQRMYIGFSDGTVSWFVLPCTANPAACDQYLYSITDGEVYLPTWHGGFLADHKTVKAFSVASIDAGAGKYAQVEYKSLPTTTYTALGHDFMSPPLQRADVTSGTDTVFLDAKVLLKSTATSAGPQLFGVGLHHQLRPRTFLIYDLLLLAEDGLIRRDGVPLRIGADQIRTVVKDAAEPEAGSITVILPDESSKIVSIVDYAETQAWDERFRQWRGALRVSAVEWGTNVIYGRYQTLEGYTYTGLEAFNYGQLEGL